jgi:hypothetical protein
MEASDIRKLKRMFANLSLENTFIAQVFKLLENGETDHQTDSFFGATESSIEWPEGVLEPLRRNDFGQSEKVVTRIQVIKQILTKEAALAVRFFRLHVDDRGVI